MIDERLTVKTDHFQTYTVASLPKYVGILRINDFFSIPSTSKPRLLHRLMMRLLLGWRWEDSKSSEKGQEP